MNQPVDYAIRARNDRRSAQVIQTGAHPALLWSNTVFSVAGCVAGFVALVLVLTKLNDYSDQIELEKRLNTQAIDEMRLEANVSRKLAGLPVVDSHEHGDSK